MIMFYCFLTVIEVKVQSTCICNNDDGMKIGRCSGYFSYSDFALCGPPTRLVVTCKMSKTQHLINHIT